MARLTVFDSGLGGLSILRALRLALPQGISWRYCADSAVFPYGRLSPEALESRVRAVMTALIAETAPDVLVIACNTASTGALAAVRADHPDLAIVGVVPAVKPAAALSASGVIGLLATPGTVASPYTDRLIAEHGNGGTVLRHGAAGLVRLAEESLRGHTPDPAALAAEIAPLFVDPKMDAVVLGCTHFPLVAAELQAVAPWPVTWIDSGEAVARQTVRVLSQEAMARHDSGDSAYLTAEGPGLRDALRAEGFETVSILAV